MYYVYLIESIPVRGEKYVGFSENLRQRLIDHNAGKNVSTAIHRPWRLCTYLAFSTKIQAHAFERYLKSGSGHAFAYKRLWTKSRLKPSRTPLSNMLIGRVTRTLPTPTR